VEDLFDFSFLCFAGLYSAYTTTPTLSSTGNPRWIPCLVYLVQFLTILHIPWDYFSSEVTI
jgi:hypothetical protein